LSSYPRLIGYRHILLSSMVSLLALSVVGKCSRLVIGAELLTERRVIGGKSESLTDQWRPWLLLLAL
jgi:hypothetical protein